MAIAADGARYAGIGIDVEQADRPREAYEAGAFTGDERALLGAAGIDTADGWSVRAWCAKEAVGKAAGDGLAGAPTNLRIRVRDETDGRLELNACGELSRRHPQLGARPLTARTTRDGQVMVAIAALERS
jgi:phosphopantetheinyl transferase